jgi:predicted enzyme related to lactoylglutathione lyase
LQPGSGGVVAYWGVENADTALARLLDLGAEAHEGVQDVGGGIRVATVTDPFGNLLGIIEPVFWHRQPGVSSRLRWRVALQ